MKRYYGYVRVSTAKQGEGVSLEAQKDAILAFADKNEIAITNWFEEKETAAKRGRPIFSGMIRALKKGDADGIVIHKIDRSARNFADWAKIGELADAGVDVHFASESLDFRSRGGRLSADIQAVIAADYIRNLREETIKGITGRLKQGLYPFKAPIGYLDNGGGKPKTPDPLMAPLIRQAFELYASGQYSLRTLRTELIRRGLRNESEKPISNCGMETILSNSFYCGLIRIRRTGMTYQGVHEPLISISLFETVQAIKAGKYGKRLTRHNHTYRGLFRCGHCNAAMTPERQKGHVYYRCHTRHCSTTCVREEHLEESLREQLSRIRLTDADVAVLEKEIAEWAQARKTCDTSKTLQMQRQLIADRLDRLTDAVVDQIIDQDTFSSRKRKLLLEKAEIEDKIKADLKTKDDPGRVRRFLELVKNLVSTYEIAVPAEKRQIVELATSNRKVVGRSVFIEPANWLVAADEAIAALIGAPDRGTSRTCHLMGNQHVGALNTISRDVSLKALECFASGATGSRTECKKRPLPEGSGHSVNTPLPT